MAVLKIDSNEKCSYNCGQIAQFQNSNGKLICCDHHNKCPEVRKKNSTGLKDGYRDGTILPKSNPSWNKGLTKESDSRVLEGAIKSKEVMKKMVPVGCCSKSYIGTEHHLAASKRGGGYRKNSGRSNGGFVTDSFGTRTWLQSSYELKLFEILTELEVRWLRPKPLPYILDGEEKRYYADFYLPDFNLYLEPKNDYLIKKEKRKFEVLNLVYPNIMVLDSSKITKEFIGSIV